MNKDIKKENKKVLPKFLGFVLICALAGGIVGLISGFIGGTLATDEMVENLYNVLNIIIPYVFVIITVIFIFTEVKLYNKAKKLYSSWNGEEEEVIDLAEEKISFMIISASTHMILSFLLFGTEHIVSPFESNSSILIILLFIINIIAVMISQQKAVDMEKAINPEKNGSVYDMKFQKKWLESCDENEIRQIGQASYKAFTAVNITCIILWLVIFFAGYLFDIGILPIITISVIWLVAQISYGIESIRLSRHR